MKNNKMLEKAGIISHNVSPWSNSIVIVPKKAQPGEQPQKPLCIDNHILNNLLQPVVKVYFKVKVFFP